MNSHSMPEIRGEPSARRVAMVLWRPASISRRTRPANSGSACSISFHVGTAAEPRCAPGTEGDRAEVIRAGRLPYRTISTRRTQALNAAAANASTVAASNQ